jgi:hypothetical protein
MQDDAPEAPLAWPTGFPPTSRWKKFFLGVRWLGPDVSFYRRNAARQAARTDAVMAAWTGDARRLALARAVGVAFARELGWKSAFFLPADQLRAIAAGPRFSLMDHGGFDAAVERIEREIGRRLPAEIWSTAMDGTLGELVDLLLEECRNDGG